MKKTIIILVIIISMICVSCANTEIVAPNNTDEATPTYTPETTVTPEVTTAPIPTPHIILDLSSAIKALVDEKMPNEAEIFYSYFPTLDEKVKIFDEIIEGTAKYAYLDNELTEDEIIELYDILKTADIETLENRVHFANTDFNISLDYDDGATFFFNADSENRVYVSCIHYDEENEWVRLHGVVHSSDLYKFIMNYAGANENGFHFSSISDTESITIQYIADNQAKNFDEDKEFTTIEITDTDLIEEIVNAITDYSMPTGTYPCREGSDIIFHTPNGDVFFKTKFPIGEWGLTEATIIAEGYFWFENVELYEILQNIN